MKIKSFDKFRKWLIKKLGGYTKSELLPPPVIKTITAQPISVVIDTSIDPYRSSSPEYKEFMIRAAYRKISDYLYENKLGRVDVYKNNALNYDIIRLKIWVMPSDQEDI